VVIASGRIDDIGKVGYAAMGGADATPSAICD